MLYCIVLLSFFLVVFFIPFTAILRRMKLFVSLCVLRQGTCLTQLDEFRSNRSEYTAKLAEMKQKVEDQRQYYADKLVSLEEKYERDRQRCVCACVCV